MRFSHSTPTAIAIGIGAIILLVVWIARETGLQTIIWGVMGW